MIMRRSVSTAAAALAVMGALVGCGNGNGEDKAASKSTITSTSPAAPVISDAWCRTSPAMADAGACYLVIRNGRDEAIRLVSASVPPEIAGEAQLHETAMVGSGGSDTTTARMGMSGSAGTMAPGGMPAQTMPGAGMSTEQGDGGGMGMMQMREVEAIEVAARSTVRLEPGGYHVMLLKLVKPLSEGETIPITLRFEGLEPIEVVAEVRSS